MQGAWVRSLVMGTKIPYAAWRGLKKQTTSKQTKMWKSKLSEWTSVIISQPVDSWRTVVDKESSVLPNCGWTHQWLLNTSMTFLTHLNRRSARTTNSSLCGLISFSMILPWFFTKSRQYKEGWEKKKKRLGTKELMLSNHGAREDSWESLGLQGEPMSPS